MEKSVLVVGERIYEYYEYPNEVEFEKVIVESARQIFGSKSIYIDIKKRIGDEILSIPDGYLLDFSFESQPKLYILENELVKHDPYKHIGQQLLKFAISYKVSGRKIKDFLLQSILSDSQKKGLVDSVIEKTNYRNIDNLLEDIIFEKEVSAIIVIDEQSTALESVLSQLTMKTDVIEFQTFKSQGDMIHKFVPFQQDIKEITLQEGIRSDELDTIVVPANEEGFADVFLGEDRWYAIRISSAMIDRIKYIAAYQTAPLSAITYYAEVANIARYKDTGKYQVWFKSKAKPIGPIRLGGKKQGAAPQSPRYTTFSRLLGAQTLADVF
ncbi:Hypothetical protein LUCI_2417 [Lucifera butyrica]|uniref:Uncharacterized protein n=1 Tax=Lucifera butyrica TaxID=1351585 RepID=A0A498RAM2_9FIRM|nr:hypothetical protein [Lucifera butyrica]VBB07173.1 Hypothetical protein LUCI_2417 [Lucifera butyrica]